MHQRLTKKILVAVLFLLAPVLLPLLHAEVSAPVYDVRNYGATGKKTDNAQRAIQKAIDACVQGVFNVGSGRETSVLELARRIVELTGSGSITFDSTFAYRPGEVGLRTWLDIRRAL